MRLERETKLSRTHDTHYEPLEQWDLSRIRCLAARECGSRCKPGHLKQILRCSAATFGDRIFGIDDGCSEFLLPRD